MYSGSRPTIPAHAVKLSSKEGTTGPVCAAAWHAPHLASGLLSKECSFSSVCNPPRCVKMAYSCPILPWPGNYVLNSYSELRKCSFLLAGAQGAVFSQSCITDGENLQPLQVGCSSAFFTLIHFSSLKPMEIALPEQVRL